MIIRSTPSVSVSARAAVKRARFRMETGLERADGQAIAPIAEAGTFSNATTQRSFSGELLRLGLEHNVEGLIRKAGPQNDMPNTVTPYDLYERAQHNFAEPHLLRWRI